MAIEILGCKKKMNLFTPNQMAHCQVSDDEIRANISQSVKLHKTDLIRNGLWNRACEKLLERSEVVKNEK